jgi:hypothetical protein
VRHYTNKVKNHMKYIPAILISAQLFLSGTGCTQNENIIKVEPRGEFATIKTEKSSAAMDAIQRGDKKVIAQVITNPQSFQPPVFYQLSAKLFQQGRRDEAMYWFYFGQLRARSDANKALDPSAAAGVDLMNETFGYPINSHAFMDIEKLKHTVEKVVSDDERLPREYDPRWISLHGMDAFVGDKVRFAPESQWAAIDKKTRKEYVEGFLDALKNFE